MTARLNAPRRVAGLAVLALLLPASWFAAQCGGSVSARAETVRPSTGAKPVVREQVLPRPRPGAASADEPEIGMDPIVPELPPGFRELARASGEPQIPGLAMAYLHPLGSPADAKHWRNIIVHRTEGPAGSAKSMALAQSKDPTKRGVTVWVETDGTVYWSTAETVIPTHGDGANRNDNKYIDNAKTYHAVVKTNSIGVEFVGNYPDVAKPATREQARAWLLLVRFLQERYDIPAENIYAHNWIDFKDRRYCEGCDLASLARKLAYEPGKR
jgi:hypothetical protein